mmetsp:Transcript_113885/g.318138  ORF Transcript_113885/g.318138 Transcript_113885/m.318138 type:complete len:213 (-) Transcript_113885:613-1251(-)
MARAHRAWRGEAGKMESGRCPGPGMSRHQAGVSPAASRSAQPGSCTKSGCWHTGPGHASAWISAERKRCWSLTTAINLHRIREMSRPMASGLSLSGSEPNASAAALFTAASRSCFRRTAAMYDLRSSVGRSARPAFEERELSAASPGRPSAAATDGGATAVSASSSPNSSSTSSELRRLGASPAKKLSASASASAPRPGIWKLRGLLWAARR